MLLKICKAWQYCLETMYWNCCEEKFCFDKKIASYNLEETPAPVTTNGVTTNGVGPDIVVTQQPINNNHLPPETITGREIRELPIHADKLYEIFSKSLIFRQEHELKSRGSNVSLEDIETKSEPDFLSLPDLKPNRTKVYFEDEVNSPVTDFEIMFKDELVTSHSIFNIEEEDDEVDRSQGTEERLTMSVEVKKQDVTKASSVTMKDETKITNQASIYKYDPISVVTLPNTFSLPRVESVRGILRQKSDVSRNLERVESAYRAKPMLNRVESLKNISPHKINKVLQRVPVRSASYLNIPSHLVPEKPKLTKSKSMLGVIPTDTESKLSSLPDTPIIKSNNLPRFFAESPSIPEYRNEVSLQSIKEKTVMMIQENDFSMPRYYGMISKSTEHLPVQESKSMPDLRNPASSGKVSKRLVKLRGRMKPLVIKKSCDEKL